VLILPGAAGSVSARGWGAGACSGPGARVMSCCGGKVPSLSRAEPPVCHASINFHALAVHGLLVDAHAGGRNPTGVLACFVTWLHQGVDEGHVGIVGQPLALAGLPGFTGQQLAAGADGVAAKLANFAAEAFVRLRQAEVDAQ
jgi:hypothetical protein